MRTKLALSTLALLAAFLAGTWYAPHTSTRAASTPPGRRILRYACPMHPQYTSDRPGVAPCCGMGLEAVYEDGVHEAPPGTLKIALERQQLAGIRIGVAVSGPVSHTIRTPGRIVPDETRTYTINASANGWIRDVYPVTTGALVAKGQPLATFYTKDFLPAQQNYFYGMGNLDRLAKSKSQTPEQLGLTQVQVWTYEDALEELGMDEIQRQEIADSRKFTRRIVMRSPAAGFVLARKVSVGQRFQRGDELYRVADLNRVWVLADVFHRESEFIRQGQKARVTVASEGREFQATVSEVLPQFDAEARTLKVRLDLDNPRFALRPGMFVDVEFPVELPAAITVPAEAVVDSGLRKTVFIDRGDGYFEPRAVETGWRFGGRVQVTRNLEPGEKIVVAGNFLLDSESRLQTVASTASHAVDPVCGMEVNAAAHQSDFRGTTYSFCNRDCKKKFDEHPQKYARAR